MSRLRVLPLLLLLLPALALLAAPAAHARSASAARPVAASCAAKGTTTVARSGQARVWVRTRGDSDEHVLVGCLLGSGRRLLLDSWFSCDCSRGDELAPQVWLRGTVVAVNRWGCPPDPVLLGPCTGRARTVDLRARRTLRSATSDGYVSQLAIGPRGAFAILVGSALVKADADGEAVLDPGPGIESGSLAFAGALLYWTRDDAPRSARLHP
jgi:hypothetical protein